jgi:hypothetical protein
LRIPQTIGLCALALGLVLSSVRAQAVVLNQVDDFEDGGTASWREGTLSPNPPLNVASGGPAGAGDHYLSNLSSGGFGSGSKQIMFNQAQWTGDYIAAGVKAIRLDMADFGPTQAFMRVVVRGANGTYLGSTAVALPPDGTWQTVTFSLKESDLLLIQGSDTYTDVLSDVTELRLLASQGGSAYVGDAIDTTIGFDNITARANDVPTESVSWSHIKAAFGE